MNYLHIFWDDPNDPDGNVQHIAEHDLEMDDVEEVIECPSSVGTSDSTGRRCLWGYTSEGIYILVVYDEIDDDTIRVATAYEVPEPH